MRDEDKKSINSDGTPLITPGQVMDISKRSEEFSTPPCVLDATAGKLKYKDLKKKLGKR